MRALLPLALLAAPALAQPEPQCIRQEVVPGFEGWRRDSLDGALAVGRSGALTLAPAETLGFTPPLTRPAKPGTFGATFPLTIARAGRYRIALSQGAWIDVVGAGQKLASVAHNHGPACSGIAKIVAFDLKPGRYLLQLSEAKAPDLAAMVVAG